MIFTGYFTGRLARYFIKYFVKRLLIVITGFMSLIYLITFVEMLRKTGADGTIGFWQQIHLTALQIPMIMEQIVPFCLLIAGLWTVTSLTQTSEMTVAKSAGISLWRIGVIFGSIGFLVGGIMIFVVNPYATSFISQYYHWENNYNHSVTDFKERLTLQGEAVIVTAENFSAYHKKFSDIGLYFLDKKDVVKQAYYAPKAIFDSQRNILHLYDAKGFSSQNKILKNYPLLKEHHLFFPELRLFLNKQSKAEDLYDIYTYPHIIKRTGQSGLSMTSLENSYFRLLFTPFLCAMMVVISVVSTPRSARSGHIILNIFLGLMAGFLFYAMDLIVIMFGNQGIFPPFWACLFAKIIVMIASIFVIIHREYGYATKGITL